MLDVFVATEKRHGEIRVRAGGTPVNAALAVGAGAVIVGRVGDDPAAAAIRRALADVELNLAVDSELPTGTYVELADGTVFADRGANAALALDDVVRRLEVRLLLEPGTARMAAERATDEDIAALEERIARERKARSALDVHDASRDFHIGVAAATQNPEMVATLQGLWLLEVGRRLLSRRQATPRWQDADVAEHDELQPIEVVDVRIELRVGGDLE